MAYHGKAVVVTSISMEKNKIKYERYFERE